MRILAEVFAWGGLTGVILLGACMAWGIAINARTEKKAAAGLGFPTHRRD